MLLHCYSAAAWKRSACMFLCLSFFPRAYPGKLYVQSSPNLVHVIGIGNIFSRGSILLRRRCNTLCTSGLWMTSCLHIMARNRRREKAYTQTNRAGGSTGSEVEPVMPVSVTCSARRLYMALGTSFNKSVFSLLRRLSAWRCFDLLLSAGVCCPRPQRS